FGEEARGGGPLTAKPFGVNLLLHFPVEDQVAVCLDERVPVLSLFWGDPTPYVRRAHAAGVKVCHQVGSAADARRAAAAGVDVIIAQGVEAGGPLAGGGFTPAPVPRAVRAGAPRLAPPPRARAMGAAGAWSPLPAAAGRPAGWLPFWPWVRRPRCWAHASWPAPSRAPTPTTSRNCCRPARGTRFVPPCSATAGPTPRTGR